MMKAWNYVSYHCCQVYPDIATMKPLTNQLIIRGKNYHINKIEMI